MSEAKVKVGFDGGAVTTGLAKMREQMHETRKSVNEEFGVGKFLAAGAIVESIHSILEEAGHLADLSDRFGVSAEGIQRIGNAAKEDGVDLDTMAMSLNKLAVAQEKARKGNTEVQKSLADLGIDLNKFINEDPEQAFYDVAEAVKGMADPLDHASELQDLFGKKALALIPILRRGGDEIKSIGDAAGVMSEQEVKTLDEAGDRLEAFFHRLKVYGADAFTWIDKAAKSIGAYVGALALGVRQLWDKSMPSGHEINETFKAQMDEIWNPKPEDEKPKKPVRTAEDSEEEVKNREKLKETYEKIDEMKREQSTQELQGEEKLQDLIARRQALYEQASGEKDAQKQADIWVKAEEFSKRIIEARQAADKEAESRADRVAKANEGLEHKRMETALANAKTDKERMKILEDAKKKLAEKYSTETDDEKKLKLQSDNEELNKQIAELQKKPVYVSASNLAKIGGGGLAYISVKDPLIERSTKANEAAAKATKESLDELKKIHTDLNHARWNP